MDIPARGGITRKAKLKSIKNGDTVQIQGEIFQVSAVLPQDGSRNISLELQAHDGGSVTFIGLPKARVQLAARAS
ncbi:hypothetical protein LN996_01740 [Arthrobacter sp. AK01]|uniref:hypothetical protein n=1 Tax=Arthrobacter sp. AK01 TaxID=2894084 RepID=UPI001E3E4E7C|nr:hypothetical protein [Arthrobacter sp. AK01]MCD4849526.1 hypothetical protein [Arthrobacter sp. AK01]